MNMEDIKEILAKQDVILDKLSDLSKDHETRIRRIEHTIAYGSGIAGAIYFLVNKLT